MNLVENENEKFTDPEEIIDAVQRMPEGTRQETMISLEMHHGPIPHPRILKEYDEMAQGTAKLIIENGVAESNHRREMEKRVLEKQINDKKRSQYLGFFIGVIVIGLGFVLIMNNHAVTGTALSGVTALGLVGAFTGSSNDDDKKSEVNKETKDIEKN